MASYKLTSRYWTLGDHFKNIIHHANTMAFVRTFFPALGSGFGWAIPLSYLALVLRLMGAI